MTVLLSSLSPLRKDHRYVDVCAFLSGRGPFCYALFLPPDGWRLIHSTCFSPIAWYKSHESHTCRTWEVLDMGKQPSTWAFTCAVERVEIQRWPAWGWLWWTDKQSHKSRILWNLRIFKCCLCSFLHCTSQMKHICEPNSVQWLPVCSLWWMGSFICFQGQLFHQLPKGFISTIA